MSRRREGGECVGKGWGAWVWRALCLRQAARSPGGTAGVGGRCDGQRTWGVGRRARGRALGKATVGVGGGEGGGVVVGGAVCGGCAAAAGAAAANAEPSPPPRVFLRGSAGGGGVGAAAGRGGVGCGLARRVAQRMSIPPGELHSPGHCVLIVWTTNTKNRCAREG